MNKIKIKYYCKDCNAEISVNSALYGKGRCASCAGKLRTGKNNGNYKHGETYCLDCKKKISFGRKRCRKCNTLFLRNNPELNSNYKDGKHLLEYFCKDCGKQICKTAGIYGTGHCRICTEKYKVYPSREGKNNNQFKDGHTLIEHFCLDCQKLLINPKSLRCRKCAQKFRLKDPRNHPMFGSERIDLQIKFAGEGNPMWQGGIANNPYPSEWSKRLKEFIRDRDNHECQLCNIKDEYLDRLLHVHHIDYNKENSKEENLISLCHKCHVKTNGSRDYYYAYFTAIIEELYVKT